MRAAARHQQMKSRLILFHLRTPRPFTGEDIRLDFTPSDAEAEMQRLTSFSKMVRKCMDQRRCVIRGRYDRLQDVCNLIREGYDEVDRMPASENGNIKQLRFQPTLNDVRYGPGETGKRLSGLGARKKPLRTYLFVQSYPLWQHVAGRGDVITRVGMGCPIEYFHVGFQPTLLKLWEHRIRIPYLKGCFIDTETDPSGFAGR